MMTSFSANFQCVADVCTLSMPCKCVYELSGLGCLNQTQMCTWANIFFVFFAFALKKKKNLFSLLKKSCNFLSVYDIYPPYEPFRKICNNGRAALLFRISFSKAISCSFRNTHTQMEQRNKSAAF